MQNWNWDWAVGWETSSIDSVAAYQIDSLASDCCKPFVDFDFGRRTVDSFVGFVCGNRYRCCRELCSAVDSVVDPLACFVAEWDSIR